MGLIGYGKDYDSVYIFCFKSLSHLISKLWAHRLSTASSEKNRAKVGHFFILKVEQNRNF
jgi:hypothetical protein